jgi:hypothetical protein
VIITAAHEPGNAVLRTRSLRFLTRSASRTSSTSADRDR